MQMGQMSGQNMAQAQQALMQAQAQGPPQAQARNMMARQTMPNGHMPPSGMRPQQGMPQPQGVGRPEHFMKQLAAFMNTKRLPLETNPTIEGRPVSLMTLFQTVSKFHGYQNVTLRDMWPQVSQAVGFPPSHVPSGPQHIQAIYERNLLKFEEAWMAQNKSKMMQQQTGMPSAGNMQPGTPMKSLAQGQMQSGQMMQPEQQSHMQPGQLQTPMKQQGPQQPNMNGFSTPQPLQQQANAVQGHSRNSLSRSVRATPTNEDFPMASPVQSKAGSVSLPGSAHPDGQGVASEGASLRFPAPFSTDPEEYFPCSRELITHGGVDIPAASKNAADLEKWKPDVPTTNELGSIDIHALTKSIQSGIHGEVRLALDTLATVTASMEPHLQLDLRFCDDLVETLVGCAEEQVDRLANDTVEVSDEVLIGSYEDVVRACRVEKSAIRDVPIFGSPRYDLDRCVDRLICITTILRNLSFSPENHKPLAEDTVIKFLCDVIRYLGTRNTLLRTQANTLDFMKDAIIFLSNVASMVEIPGREQALCLLSFILAFAPSPAPSLSNDRLFFSSYDPALHPYLAPAVDSLAKLLARDEPNRTHYKSIFAADAAVSPSGQQPSCELLTRAFALAVAPIPDQNRDSRPANLPSFVESRKPFLMQGLLAACILASLAPGHETGVTRAWLSCGNGFAQNLFRLVRYLSGVFEGLPNSRGGGPQQRPQNKKDAELVYIVGLGVSMLKKLCEKARDPTNPTGEGSIPPNVLPSRDSVLGALQMGSAEWTKEGMLADLVAYAGLED
jgi:SWI/SNF chromatin-remodeling complex subunit SWI1